MSEGVDLENAISSLDEDGWNTRGVVQRCTFARIFMTKSLITEEILEISMGFLSSEELIRRAADIEKRAIEMYKELPPFLHIDDDAFTDMNRAPIELLFMSYIRMDDLYHHFLLQRILIKKVGADSAKLLAIAREMFSFSLVLINHKDVFKDFQVDFIQLLTLNGISAAAVIAVELLHQEQDPTSTSALTSPLPRSDTIQDLSVFCACLGTCVIFLYRCFSSFHILRDSGKIPVVTSSAIRIELICLLYLQVPSNPGGTDIRVATEAENS